MNDDDQHRHEQHHHHHHGHHHHEHGADGIEDHDLGLGVDLSTLLQRRNLLRMFAGGAGLLTLAACGSDANNARNTTGTPVPSTATTVGTATTTGTGGAAAASTVTTATATEAGGSCDVIPEETAGPFPADGSNGINVLAESGIVRSDIRSSFGASTTVAEGVPITVDLTFTDTSNGCAPLAGAAVYVWHCDRDGQYSLYSDGAADENYLRGVQETDADGRVSFISIFPACYPGRWPHMHFEVYPSLASATSADAKLATSQLALPKDVCDVVYATDGYASSVESMSQVSLQSDNVFGDGADLETPTATGTVSDGYVFAMTVTV